MLDFPDLKERCVTITCVAHAFLLLLRQCVTPGRKSANEIVTVGIALPQMLFRSPERRNRQRHLLPEPKGLVVEREFAFSEEPRPTSRRSLRRFLHGIRRVVEIADGTAALGNLPNVTIDDELGRRVRPLSAIQVSYQLSFIVVPAPSCSVRSQPFKAGVETVDPGLGNIRRCAEALSEQARIDVARQFWCKSDPLPPTGSAAALALSRDRRREQFRTAAYSLRKDVTHRFPEQLLIGAPGNRRYCQ